MSIETAEPSGAPGGPGDDTEVFEPVVGPEPDPVTEAATGPIDTVGPPLPEPDDRSAYRAQVDRIDEPWDWGSLGLDADPSSSSSVSGPLFRVGAATSPAPAAADPGPAPARRGGQRGFGRVVAHFRRSSRSTPAAPAPIAMPPGAFDSTQPIGTYGAANAAANADTAPIPRVTDTIPDVTGGEAVRTTLPMTVDEIANYEPPGARADVTAPDLNRGAGPRAADPDHPEEELNVHLVGEEKALSIKSHEIAERRLSEALEAHKGIRGVFDRIWKGNLARDYYLLKQKQAARADILREQNMFVHDGTDASVHRREVSADVDRFVHEYHQSMDEGEHRTQLTDPAAQPIVRAMHQLIREAVVGNWDEEAFREARVTRINEMARDNPGLLKEASLYGDNLGQIIEQVRARVAAGANLDNILARTRIYLDESNMGVRTEAKFSTAEKIVEKLHGTKIGSMVNEGTLVTAVSVAYSLGRASSRSALGAVGRSVGLFGVSSGIFAGVRESGRMKTERAQHLRERAQGIAPNFGDETRRAEFEKSVYGAVTANQGREMIESVLYERRSDGTLELRAPTAETLNASMNVLADMDTRRALSAQMGIDLIHFSSAQTVASERKALYLAMAQARGDLARMAAENPGMISGVTDTASFNALMESKSATLLETRNRDVSAKNKTFNKFRRHEIRKAVVKATLFGAALGLVGQEVSAFFNPNEMGELKSLTEHYAPDKANVHQTVLRALFNRFSGKEQFVGGGAHHAELINGHVAHVPVGAKLVAQHNGSFDLMNGNHVEAAGLHFKPDGQLTTASMEHLKGTGVMAEVHRHVVSTKKVRSHSMSPREYVKTHPKGVATVRRELWYDDNSPNETIGNGLKLTWGGNNGLDAHGNIVLSVRGMTPGGSFHDGLSANAQELLKHGKMELMLSMDKGTQAHPFGIHINSHGDAIIDRNSEAGRLFKIQEQGGVKSARFVGKYAEADQVMSHHNGVTNVRMLATAVGEGVKSMRVPTEAAVEHTVYSTTFNVVAERPVSIPPFIPIYARRGLESVAPAPEAALPLVAPVGAPEVGPIGYYGGPTAEMQRRWEEDRSPRLRENADADLNMREELTWYFEQQAERYGQAYTQRLRERVIGNSELRNMSGDVKSVICIAVAAASEGENIYDTLSLYAQQDADALQGSVFLLSVNWPSDADPAKVKETHDAIERARRDFPNVKIADFEQILPREWIENRDNAAHGQLMKDLFDTAMMAINEKQQTGQLKSEDVLVLSNDADARGVSKHMLRNYQKTMTTHPEADMLLGTIRWGTESFDDYPGYATAVTALQLMQQMVRRPNSQTWPSTTGPNAGIRASMLAAIGGTNGEIGAGADIDMGHRVWSARLGQPVAIAPVGSGSGGAATGTARKRREIGRMVVGAAVDSHEGRLLGTYMSGRSLTEAWLDFNEGGYLPRNAVPLTGRERDDSPEVIMDRVEAQLSSIISVWFGDEHVYASAFDLMFPPGGERGVGGAPQWHVTRGTDGRNEFKFTPEGRALAAARFERYGELIAKHMANTHVRPIRPGVSPSGGSGSGPVSPDSGDSPDVPATVTSARPARGASGEVARTIDAPLSRKVSSRVPGRTMPKPAPGGSVDIDDRAASKAVGDRISQETAEGGGNVGHTDDDVIALETARLREAKKAEKKKAKPASSPGKADSSKERHSATGGRGGSPEPDPSAEPDSSSADSGRAAERTPAPTVTSRELVQRVESARTQRELFEIGEAALEAGLFDEEPRLGKPTRPGQRFRPSGKSGSAALYHALLDTQEGIAAYHDIRTWLNERSLDREGAAGSERRAEVARLQKIYGPAEAQADPEFSLTVESVDAIMHRSRRPAEHVIASLQVQLAAAGHLRQRPLTAKEAGDFDVRYNDQRTVRFIATDNVGLYALELIDETLGRPRRRKIAA
ncbi:MAG TPA: hypothetical protein VMS08_02560 [Candidatus Saccharimonadia bacterium]|nr:hypothetical protein [Candidatus Saccharimonadia bacterium]